MSLKDLIASKRRALAASGRKDRPVKPPQGKSRWRILPGWRGDGDETFYRDFGQHFIKGDDGSVKAVYTCNAVTNGESCDVCNAVQAFAGEASTDAEQKQAKDMRANKMMLFNALHRDGETPDKPVILGVSSATATDILSVLEDFMDETDGNPLDLDNGTDIVIERTGSGLDTKYRVALALKSKPVDKSVLGQLHNLDDYVLESDEGRLRALAAVSAATGMTALPSAGASAAAGALTGPSKSGGAKKGGAVLDAEPEDLDDEIPFDGASSEDADAGTDGADDADTADADGDAGTVAGAEVDMSDDDIDALLGDLT